MQDEITGYKGASETTGLLIGTLYSKVSRNSIPHFRYGPRCVRFSRNELQKWIESHKVETQQKQKKAKGGSHG